MAKYIRTKRNIERGQRAYDAIEAYDGSDEELKAAEAKRDNKLKRALVEQVMGDLLCDMRHLAAQYHLDFELVVQRSDNHFGIEATDRTGLG